ncbi:MAG: superoxide dismutase family protein [Acidobacteriaceae bacterium]|jgi:Cu-Zn family superoxide dismutase|nr:superoxide dismutase family protein [Acidobacteriaceae bacterium]
MLPKRIAVATVVMLAAGLFATTAQAKSSPKMKVVVALHASDGTDVGTATFTQQKKGVHIHIAAKNLPVGDHAVHVHQFPKCDAPDFKTAGGHFNPDGKKHGMENPMGHHNGDMPGNLTIGETHTGTADFTVNYLSMDPFAPTSIFANGGTALVIHDHKDDMMTDPTGNAGNRIACGVIVQ